jgi:hypothetical protein
LVYVSADQVVVINRINVVVEGVKLGIALARRSGEGGVYTVGPEKLRVLRAHVSLAHQIRVAYVRIRPCIYFVVAAVTINTLESELGMSRRYAYVAVDASSTQKRGRADLR